MDTSKDARILVLEDALKRLNDIVKHRRLKFQISYSELSKILGLVENIFYEIKYCYLEPRELSELDATKSIIDVGMKFQETYEEALKSTGYESGSTKEKLVHAEVKYALRIIDGFPNRLLNYNEDPAHAVDILAVEITQTKPVEGSDNLTECRCTDGSRIWTIVTNIKGISVGEKMSCAILPPAEMISVVSEAMFLGSEQLPDSTQLGILSSPSKAAIDQARAQVMGIMKRLK